MEKANIHEAKTHLSRLFDEVEGEPFVVAKSGKPLVKVIALSESHAILHRC